jgi:Domain of unknown function (DUF4277)
MLVSVQHSHPIAHLPLVLGVLRRLEVATVIDRLIPPHPAHELSCGRGVEDLGDFRERSYCVRVSLLKCFFRLMKA